LREWELRAREERRCALARAMADGECAHRVVLENPPHIVARICQGKDRRKESREQGEGGSRE
jgi:hypothetical protein